LCLAPDQAGTFVGRIGGLHRKARQLTDIACAAA
jgi:hypothetical protein